MDPFVGEIRMFAGNYAPVGWSFCFGQLLNIADNQALYALIGNRFGGDGITNFGLPDLRGRWSMPNTSGSDLNSQWFMGFPGQSVCGRCGFPCRREGARCCRGGARRGWRRSMPWPGSAPPDVSTAACRPA